jgi:hypothetical protein
VTFLQAANDFDTTPPMALAGEMATAGKPHAQKIFPAHGTTAGLKQGDRHSARHAGPEPHTAQKDQHGTKPNRSKDRRHDDLAR